MVKAVWKGTIIAESNKYEIVENNYYFPPESLNMEYFRQSSTHSECFWKGRASYYDIEVNGEINKDAAWYYPSPKDRASNIRNYVAFWKGIEVN